MKKKYAEKRTARNKMMHSNKTTNVNRKTYENYRYLELTYKWQAYSELDKAERIAQELINKQFLTMVMKKKR